MKKLRNAQTNVWIKNAQAKFSSIKILGMITEFQQNWSSNFCFKKVDPLQLEFHSSEPLING